jgi:hypothetical protein
LPLYPTHRGKSPAVRETEAIQPTEVSRGKTKEGGVNATGGTKGSKISVIKKNNGHILVGILLK